VDKLEREPLEKTKQKLAALTPKVDDILAFANQKTAQDELRQVFDKLGDLAKFCEVDFRIVRGLAYYTGIVWEIHDRKGELRAVAGGGRYDNLMKLVGGTDLPALGFGMGDVVLTELLEDRGLLPKLDWELDCYVVIADEALRRDALKLIHELRSAGIAVDYALTPAKVGKQFQAAAASGARFALVVGPEEWKSGEVKIKNLATSAEERVKISDVVGRVPRRGAA
jgi:histidyl-tRNA synthetase